MRFKYFIFIILCSLSTLVQAYELIVIQAVSDSKKTFITRNGKRQGISQGMTGTFTAEDFSILAKAVTVTGENTQWEIINPDATLPFEKGTLVTYYPATEYIWALSPEEDRKKYIKSQIHVPRQSIVVKGAFTRGLSDSVSNAPAGQSKRGGILGEIYFERDLIYNLAFDVGFRYEKEVVNYEGSSFLTQRNLVIADLLYYIDSLKDLIKGKLFIGAGMGYGVSSTTTMGLAQSGKVGLLPAVKMGMTYPFNNDWEFLFDAAFESLQTVETQQGGNEQSTTQTNFRTGIGLRRFF